MRSFSQRVATLVPVLLVWSCTARPDGWDMASKPVGKTDPVVQDPLEPVNRFTWQVNRAMVLGLLDPLTTAYVSIVPEPVRDSVGRVRKNLGAPSRVVNQVLQGRWQDSGRESLRFLANTTLGVGGVFDVAGKMDLPGSKADFNQTFRHWGMRPKTYLVLPALGPSDEVHAVASLLDIASDPTNYVAELSAVGHATRFHRMSEISTPAAAFFRTEADSYSTARLAWPYLARTSPPDWTMKGPPDKATLDSLSAALPRLEDPMFGNRARERRAWIAGTKQHLPYSLWLQNKPAPMVFLAPGVGSHRQSANSLMLAEAMFRMGFSVATISGIFHPEFMEKASTAPMPGNSQWDRTDMLAAWTAVDASINKEFRGKVTGHVLAGFSLGGYMALQLAGTEPSHATGSVRFDRYVAIQTPVDLRHAYDVLDDYADTPARWPEDERSQRIDTTFHKAVAMLNGGPPPGVAPFDADESRFLVGYSFRRVLRDAIFSLQRRGRCGGLAEGSSTWHREHVYQELREIRFDEYYHDWLKPAETQLGTSVSTLEQATDLMFLQNALSRHSGVRLVLNRNDFLLSAADMAWIKRTFGDRAEWLPDGGHLGNLGKPELHHALHRALNGE